MRSKGRGIVLAIITGNLLASVLSMLYLAIYNSPGALIQHAIRLVFYVVLSVFLYRGLPWRGGSPSFFLSYPV